MLEPLIRKFVEDLELGEMPPKQEGNLYELVLSSEIALQLRELDPGVSFWAKIGPCPPAKKEELFILLMKANLLGQGTGGAVIGMDENENFLTLSSVLPYDMSYKTFKDALEDFANYLDYWGEELQKHLRN